MPLFGKKPTQKTTTVFFATDVHGSERTFRKFINAGKFYNAQVLVMGGDIIGKMAVPIIQESTGRYRATLQGRTERLEGEEALKALRERIGTLGFYSKILKEDEFRELAADRARVDVMFHDLARERLESWVDLAESRLAGTGIRCYVTGGNDDYPDVLEALYRPNAEALVACEGQVIEIDGDHTMISMGYSSPTPWKTPREIPDEELGLMIDKMIAQVADPSRCIFNFHDPPVDSTLDTCPLLDWSTDPPTQIVKAGQVVLHGAGSHSVRKAVEAHQPVAGLHGHIHESPGATRIGRTLCVNPGSEYGEGVLRGVLLNLAGGKVESYQLTSG
jgi:Icc-related predicted phosphoesterase